MGDERNDMERRKAEQERLHRFKESELHEFRKELDEIEKEELKDFDSLNALIQIQESISACAAQRDHLQSECERLQNGTLQHSKQLQTLRENKKDTEAKRDSTQKVGLYSFIAKKTYMNSHRHSLSNRRRRVWKHFITSWKRYKMRLIADSPFTMRISRRYWPLLLTIRIIQLFLF